MDVDNATATLPFKKLTDEERAKYRAEGRCFRCRTQGHMARNCPKGSSRPNAANAHAADASASTNETTPPVNTTPPATTTPTPAKTALTVTQQIRALEETMNKEERGAYLDARDMGEDFCSAGF